MSSTGSAPRRSLRLLRKSVNSQRQESNERARKKVRIADSSKGSQGSRIQTRSAKRRGITILSLPDEPLRLIFVHLGACKTDGTFARPRHAFQLAQTNTRLLNLFGSLVTRINPFIAEIFPGMLPECIPSTLSPQHILSAARIAGQALQELHLPQSSFKLLPRICSVCPGLKVLSVVSDPEVRTNVFASVVGLSLHSLSITEPWRDHLDLLVPAPPELTLTKMNYRDIDGLKSILRKPPKKFNLEIYDYNIWLTKSNVTNLLRYLKVAIPKMESASISVSSSSWLEPDCWSDEAADLIGAVRNSGGDSTCMSLSLKGHVLFGLVTKANRNAKIELNRAGDTFGSDGDGIYVLTMHPCDHYLSAKCNFSRLREVSIDDSFDPGWKQIFSSVRLKKAYIEDSDYVTDVSLSVETLELHLANVKGNNWNWLSNARHIHLLSSKEVAMRTLNQRNVKTARVVLFEALASLLQQFHGDTIWIDCIILKYLEVEGYAYRFAKVVKSVHAAAERFEERGGDAGTLKTLVAEIMTRWRR